MSNRTVHHTPSGFTFTSEPIASDFKPKTKVTRQRVSITTLDRRLQVIRKWQSEGLITAAKAKALTDEVLEAL
ncbi:MAG TPA: hypothetical protein VK302_22310 [Terriglobales bacterium]|nr:hypothetical protein [Terriglobales bacterium]